MLFRTFFKDHSYYHYYDYSSHTSLFLSSFKGFAGCFSMVLLPSRAFFRSSNSKSSTRREKILHAATPDELVSRIGKTTDVSSNIWEQALKTPDLELQTVQLKSKEIKTA